MRRRGALWLLPVITATLLALAPGAARAQAAADPTSPVRLGFRLRVQPTYLAWTLVFHAPDWILPSLVGLSLAVELDRRWTVEVGTSHMPAVIAPHNDALGADAFVRGGFSPKIGGRGGASSWTHHLLVYGGYRYLVLELGNDAMHDPWPNHGLVANLGWETTRWITRRVGVCARLLVGFDLLLRRQLEPPPIAWRRLPTGPVEAAFAFDVGLDLGLAF